MENVDRDIFIRHVHPEDADIRLNAYKQAQLTGKLSYAARFIWNDGSIHWVEALGSYRYNKAGEAVTFSGTVSDITEERLKNAEMQVIQSRLQSIFQHVSLGIALTDLEGRYTLVNPAYTRIVGYTEDELYELNMQAVSYAGDWERKKAMLSLLFDAQRSEFEIEKRYIHKDGHPVWARNNVSLLYDEAGKPANIIIISEDITPQIEWKQEQQKLRKLVDNSVDMMAILGLNGKNTYINKAGMDMLGFEDQEQVLNTPIADLHTPEDYEKVSREVIPVIMKEGRWSGTIMIRNLVTGERIPVYNNTTRIDHPLTGVPMAIGAVMRDLRPELKAQKEQQKLIALLEKSSDFVSLSDLEGNVNYVNEAGRRMLGIESQEELEVHNSNYLPASEIERLKNEVNKGLFENGRWMGEILYRHFKTGEEIPVYGHTMLVYDEITGAPFGRATISRDLRQEKAFNKALKESEQRFRSMVEQAPVAIGVLRGEQMIVETANDALLGLWGRDRSVMNLPLAEALPELRDQPFLALIEQVYTTGLAHYGFETPANLGPEGALITKYFNFIYAPFREAGKITGVQILASEVTGQVKIKKELEASEERFRNFVTNAPTPIGVYIGREMRIQTVNEAILKTWDRDASVVGKTFREALPELEGLHFHQLLDDVYTTGVPYTANEAKVDLFVHGSLKTHYFNFTYKPLFDGNGDVYGVINTATDVTDLVLARKQLTEAEERLRLAVESAEIATWNINLQTGEVNFSARAREWYGFTGANINMHDGFKAIHEEDRERAIAAMEKALTFESGGNYEDEYRVISLQTGEVRIVRPSAKVIFGEQQEPLMLTGVVRDITRQKMQAQEMEDRVQQRTRELQLANIQLKQTNEELEQYAYVASHDLQEPLRKIRMFSSMLKDNKELSGLVTIQTYIDKISASAARMSLLIKDLLDFSRVSAKEELFTTVQLDYVLANVIHDFELLIEQKQAIITSEPLPTIAAIPLQMNQLFYNLMGNALKFTPPGKAPEIGISCRQADDALLTAHHKSTGKTWHLITVTDNGIGFDDFLKEKIFTIFQRLNTREQYEGTGIGLALCRKIVLSHGGDIWAESESGKGASFYLLLPEKQ
ncbi:PAS domain S-box protein [Chitinophaga horti]|uniref:histidine kinase n=1 Tax=Chitinophaga horti TaxID=2920382 RepID=A0ABY6J486_9BACT|nr:PAS domain S-box protein [Chitinophaga horti]UYQ94315.1 PAS domain S-box protein [Chitinophaga horti]